MLNLLKVGVSTPIFSSLKKEELMNRKRNIVLSVMAILISLIFITGCYESGGGSGGGSDSGTDVDFYGTSNGRCGGCCSWHGGVACGENGKTICADGTNLSSTCRSKGCRVNECGDADKICESKISYPGGESYVDFDRLYTTEETHKFGPLRSGPDGDGVVMDPPLPSRDLLISFIIDPIHKKYPKQCNGTYYRDLKIGFWFEAICDGCEEFVTYKDGSLNRNDRRYSFRYYITVKLKNGQSFEIYSRFHDDDHPEFEYEGDMNNQGSNYNTGRYIGWLEFPYGYEREGIKTCSSEAAGHPDSCWGTYKMSDIETLEACFTIDGGVQWPSEKYHECIDIPMFKVR